ncbi:MAG: TRAP transporter, 4TM/12TM fusion protein [Candidatus Rokubacteria bacterium CSP1-6]|nr:MAG: TRAP transporter, 4TM/12TM fusion protein [Candidatus Rokubacteria bacterium CSP1-6]
MRKLSGYPGIVVGVVGVVMALYHVYARLTPVAPDSLALRILTLAFSLVLAFLLYPRRKGGTPDRIPWSDLLLTGLSLAALAYLFLNYAYVTSRFPTADPLSAGDMLVAGVATLLVLEATRRTIGSALPIVAGCFITYGLLGPWMPGFLRHKGLTLEILLDQTYFTTEGIFGIPLAVAGSYVILFIIFGAFLEKSGAGQFFMNFANAIAGGARGGPGKVAVVSSSLFGTISGSAVANVMVDGWLTIPMMKKTGFKPEAAAAIEAVASTGGQIMPPIMGAAAFVMAEFLGASYTSIMIAAAIPAIFYYVALFAAIHFNAVRTGLKGIPRNELPILGQIIWRQGHLFVPVLVILVLLLQGFTATYAAIVSAAAVVVLSWIRPETRVGLRKGIQALRDGAEQTVPVAMATASAGIVIGIILQTGLAIRFTSFLVDLAGGKLIVALLITMVAGIILGMGMPTTPAYIMQAAILIPALIKLGVQPLAAHMFAFYFSCLSAVTPPVALAVYAAASISRCGLWGAGLQAVKFAAAGFIVPFFFVYSPSLLFQGAWAEIVRAVVTGSIGTVALAAALEGQFLRVATWLERGLFAAAALLLIDPGLTTDLIGLGVLALGLLMQKVWTPASLMVARERGSA